MSARITEQQRQALKMAASWFATLCAGDATSQQHARWQQWHQQHEVHRWAWQRVEPCKASCKKCRKIWVTAHDIRRTCTLNRPGGAC